MNNISLYVLLVFVLYILIIVLFTLRIASRERESHTNGHRLEQSYELDIDVEITIDKAANMARAETIVKNPVPSENYTYAFYLIVNGVRTTVRWHEENAVFEFLLPSSNEKTEILAFAKGTTTGTLATVRKVLEL